MAVAALIWAACGNEDFLENNPGNEVAKPEFMTFTASAPQTRTQLDGLNVAARPPSRALPLCRVPTIPPSTP